MGDVQQDGFLPMLPVGSVPQTSSPGDYVYPQSPVCGEQFAALQLVSNS